MREEIRAREGNESGRGRERDEKEGHRGRKERAVKFIISSERGETARGRQREREREREREMRRSRGRYRVRREGRDNMAGGECERVK